MNESPPVFYRTSSPSGPLPCFPSLRFTITQSRATGIADHILPLGDLLQEFLYPQGYKSQSAGPNPSLEPRSQPQGPIPSFKTQVPASRSRSQPYGSNPSNSLNFSIDAQIPAPRARSYFFVPNSSLKTQIPYLRTKS